MATVITPSNPPPVESTTKKKKRAKGAPRAPRLEPEHLIAPHAVQSALHIGRKYAKKEVKTGEEHQVLDAFLKRMQGWMGDVAPGKMSVGEFVVQAVGMGGKKEIKGVLGDVRLAEFREVTGGWEELVRKRKKKKGVEEVEGREEDEEIGDVEEKQADEAGEKEDGKEESKSDAIDKEIMERIERNRQKALEKRRKAMEIDREDVVEREVEEQEDIDMDVFDEMELHIPNDGSIRMEVDGGGAGAHMQAEKRGSGVEKNDQSGDGSTENESNLTGVTKASRGEKKNDISSLEEGMNDSGEGEDRMPGDKKIMQAMAQSGKRRTPEEEILPQQKSPNALVENTVRSGEKSAAHGSSGSSRDGATTLGAQSADMKVRGKNDDESNAQRTIDDDILAEFAADEEY